jgi:C-terminal processing protease CtpA/Prc
MAAELFGRIMEKFESETDSLVIDQVNNPGGNMFYMYALLSHLTDKPLALPDQRIIIGEEDAMQASQLLQADPFIQTDMDAMRALGPSLGGYPVTLKVWKQFAGYFRFIMGQLREGKRLTDLVAMMGVKEVEPHATQRYTKPIVVLVNELDFSSADFFPAILQDNGRAKLFGVRTAGAGGAVKPVQFPNQFGIGMISYTWTLAMRASGKPIENLGVTPEHHYALTERDFREGYAGYREALGKVVSRMIKQNLRSQGTAPAQEETPETPNRPE